MERLFVYGTLGPNQPNEQVLSSIGGIWQSATVVGKLLFEGWGSKMGYPGLRLDKHGVKINGHVFSSDNLSSHWSKLDEFEGEEYCRVLAKVKTENQSLIDAYIYVLR